MTLTVWYTCFIATSCFKQKCDRPWGYGTRLRHRHTRCGSLCSCLWHRSDSIWWLLASRAERRQASSFLPKTTVAQSVDSPRYCSSCPRKTERGDHQQECSRLWPLHQPDFILETWPSDTQRHGMYLASENSKLMTFNTFFLFVL